MSWSGKQVVVTGGGGFIGSHLAERLVELGAKVRVLVHYNSLGTWGWLEDSKHRQELEVVSGDIVDADCVRQLMKGADTVFHLAALIAIPYSYRAPSSYVQTNVVGTLNVMQAARDLGTRRVLHTSTSEVYGTARTVPISESHPLQGQSPYSASKIGADKIAESFYLSFETPVVTVRPFNTFGPRQSARAVIPTIITQCQNQKSIKLGKLSPTRDFNFVSNTVDGFVRAAEVDAAIGKTINFGSGKEISIGDLAKLIMKHLGRELPIETDEQRHRPEKSEVERLLADNSLAKQLLGWTPKVDFEAGLAITIPWLQDHLSRYRTNVYNI